MIRLDNVSKYYVGNNEVTTGLRKINLEFNIGELVAVTGESGSGKSTLLNVISGTDTYEEGELYINGKSTSYFDESDWERYRRENIGFIYQNYNLIDSYTVLENVLVALMIKRCDNDSEKKAKEYLDKVGLGKYADKKAGKLSSGQKQRLSIARALAKETDILVADEPTGNLDIENSREIMALLNELSVDKLVIVVTHNYDEIEPYATRKIRMYDGQVAEDILLRPAKLSDRTVKKSGGKSSGEETGKSRQNRNMISSIAFMTQKNKPLTWCFMLIFLFMVSVSIFILMGSFIGNTDTTTWKKYDSSKFINKDTSRLIVMREDGGDITDDDVNRVNQVSKVECVEKYDYLADTCYMIKENEDFKYEYNKRHGVNDYPDYKRPQPVKKDKFMKSVTCIDEDDLAAGKMPEGLYEAAMYGEDGSIIGKELTVYLSNSILWGGDCPEIKITVTGVLKEKTEQIYFSEKMAQMITSAPDRYIPLRCEKLGINVKEKKYVFSVKSAKEAESDVPHMITVYPESDEEREEYLQAANTQMSSRPIFFVDERLTGNEAIVSNEFISKSYGTDNSKILPYNFYNIVSVNMEDTSSDVRMMGLLNDIMPYKDMILEWQEDLKDESLSEREKKGLEDAIEKYEKIIERPQAEYDRLEKEKKIYSDYLEIQEETSLSTANVIYVSKEYFEENAGFVLSKQMTVYMDDYAYADSVIEKLKDMGYVAASAYRIGALEYDYDIVNKKMVSMGISVGALIMIFIIGVFIAGMMMNSGEKDFYTLRLLGIERNDVNAINRLNIVINVLAATAAGLAATAVLNLTGVPYIKDIVKYYRWYHYIIYGGIVAGFIFLMNIRSRARVGRMK